MKRRRVYVTILTEQEEHVLASRLEGRTLKAIASGIGRSINTVSEHQRRAIRKLGARSLEGARRKWLGDLVTRVERLSPAEQTLSRKLSRKPA